jgi:YVTN family beta-propeller protein
MGAPVSTAAAPTGPRAGSAGTPASLTNLASSVHPAEGVGRVVATVTLAFGVWGVAADPTNGVVVVTEERSNDVAVLSTATNQLLGRVPVGSLPDAVAFDSQNGWVYVANAGSDNVSVIDPTTEQVVDTIPVGPQPCAVAFDPLNGYVYVVNRGTGSRLNPDNVTVVDGRTDLAVASIIVGSAPDAVAVDTANGRVFVANNNSDNVTVIDGTTDSVVDSVVTGEGPTGLAFDSRNGFLFETNNETGNVTVLNGSSDNIVGWTRVGTEPSSIAFDGQIGYLDVTNWGSDNVSVINGTFGRLVGSLPVGREPRGMAFDGANGYFYVANYLSGTLSVINASYVPPPPRSYAVTFEETGLASRTPWSVTLDGVANASTTASIGFRETNGTNYLFNVAPIAGYAAAPSRGTVNVTGAPTSVTIAFSVVTYPVWFRETGLPTGTNWSVGLAATENASRIYQNSSTTGVIGIWLPVGFTARFDVRPVTGYLSDPQNGTFTTPADGAALTEPITFTFVPPAPTIRSFNVTPAGPVAGSAVTFTVVVANGSPPLEYAYVGLPGGCASNDVARLTCTPVAAGRSSVMVIVTDNLARQAVAGLIVTVSAPENGSTTPTILGLPDAEVCALAGAGIVIVAVVALTIWARKRRPSASPGPPDPLAP